MASVLLAHAFCAQQDQTASCLQVNQPFWSSLKKLWHSLLLFPPCRERQAQLLMPLPQLGHVSALAQWWTWGFSGRLVVSPDYKLERKV